MSTHEHFESSHEIQGPSDRSFGVVFTLFFAAVGLVPLRHGNSARWWALALALMFLVVTWLRPALLHTLNVLWMKLSLLLNRIITPVVMALLFYVAVTPLGFLRRLLGNDPLRLKFDPESKTYWQSRQPPGPAPETMSHQF